MLTNTGTVPATNVRLTLSSDTRPGTRRRRIAIALCDTFGLDVSAERLRAALPPTTQELTTNTTRPVDPEHTIPIFPTPTVRWDWLEIDWSSTDQQTHWTKLTPPA